MNANIGELLHDRAVREPARTAIVDAGRDGLACRYGDLDASASAVAASLGRRGIKSGDRVAICTDNGLDFVAAWFGAVYAGCATLPVPAMSTPREVAFRLQHAGCKALLCDAAHLSLGRQSQALAQTETTIISVDDAIECGDGPFAPVDSHADEIAMILYTSGTTGSAKGVCITHESLRRHTAALVERTLRLKATDRVLGVLPLTHSYGIRMTLLAPFCAGASTIFSPRFSPGKALALCREYGVTWLPGVPTMFVAWANADPEVPPPTLRWCMSSGAPLVEDVRLRAEAQLGAPVRQGYGLTEATFSTINAPPDDAVPGSVGAPVAGVELRIVDDASQEVPAGSRGEVLIRGQNVMAGYLDDPAATAEATRDGWLHTGDVGFVDSAGRLTLVGRSKDLILRGGHSIYPFEVEDALGAHPDIQEAAVVGVPDDYYGEEIVAVVVSEGPPSPEALDAWMRERLAPIKVPRAYAFVDTLPQGLSGKVLKRSLRERLVEGAIVSRRVAHDRTTE
ncbi:MAG: AMP-binding protein [Polyangiales bacterium]